MDLQLVLLALSTEVQQMEAAKELLQACTQGGLELARMLLEAGANKNAEDHDEDGNTALMLTAEWPRGNRTAAVGSWCWQRP